ncbi:AraC family transcriptional regulator [Phycisphaera mikurensis]|nr:helix-turn-helix transcriptional regulator [Phycisphaera mikurensis]MBB6441204.1 AraC-like DNA-binding protein [Phycisphaera mikurensis]
MSQSHRHDELELNLVTAGRAAYVVDGRRVELNPDAALWLWPDQEHLLIQSSEAFAMWVVVWRQDAVRAAAGGDGDGCVPLGPAASDAALLAPRALSERVAADLCVVAAGIARARSPGHEAAGLAWLLREAWGAFLAAEDVPSGSRLHPAVEGAARWLGAHAHEPAADDLDALAARCGLSRSRLSRLFAAQVGETLAAHRQRRRLEAALRHLGAAGRDGTPGRATMLDAAFAGGFGSYPAFYRAHVAHLGCGPAEARRAERGGR